MRNGRTRVRPEANARAQSPAVSVDSDRRVESHTAVSAPLLAGQLLEQLRQQGDEDSDFQAHLATLAARSNGKSSGDSLAEYNKATKAAKSARNRLQQQREHLSKILEKLDVAAAKVEELEEEVRNAEKHEAETKAIHWAEKQPRDQQPTHGAMDFIACFSTQLDKLTKDDLGSLAAHINKTLQAAEHDHRDEDPSQVQGAKVEMNAEGVSPHEVVDVDVFPDQTEEDIDLIYGPMHGGSNSRSSLFGDCGGLREQITAMRRTVSATLP